MREQKKDFCHSVSSSSTIGKRGETYHHNSHCNLGLGYVSLGGKHMPLFYVLLCHHDICCAAGDWIYSVDISTMCVCVLIEACNLQGKRVQGQWKKINL